MVEMENEDDLHQASPKSKKKKLNSYSSAVTTNTTSIYPNHSTHDQGDNQVNGNGLFTVAMMGGHQPQLQGTEGILDNNGPSSLGSGPGSTESMLNLPVSVVGQLLLQQQQLQVPLTSTSSSSSDTSMALAAAVGSGYTLDPETMMMMTTTSSSSLQQPQQRSLMEEARGERQKVFGQALLNTAVTSSALLSSSTTNDMELTTSISTRNFEEDDDDIAAPARIFPPLNHLAASAALGSSNIQVVDGNDSNHPLLISPSMLNRLSTELDHQEQAFLSKLYCYGV